MNDECSPRLDLLILAKLATTSKRPPSVGRLEQDLLPFVEARLSRREWSSRLAERVEVLRGNGELDARRVPTQKGLQRLRRALGVRDLPARWSEIWRALIPALMLELPGEQWLEVASADKLRARLIRQSRGLVLPEIPTLAQAVDAQIWQALGLPEAGPLTLGKLRRAVLERTLGVSIRAKSIDGPEAGRWLATAAAGTPTRDIIAIQRALIGRWLFEAKVPDTADERKVDPKQGRAKSLAVASSRGSEPMPLERWAERIQRLADTVQSGRYGEERAFIASVWQAAQADPTAPHDSLPAFKTRLVEANRAGLLRLHRADLVGAMDERLVRESETRHLNATFHFIEIDPRRPS
ncbi:hypothetical protein [Paraliomyxa miuraensis]|uniref:hypothetical protein n=1 Tax=Paraliomyxa miuraensis TaxID=376150 RepID=UPI002258D6E0|nr:hypothetical protein [Paraliomyxa miuraensis]MCX4243947.1 hypothetical protein [Paraliomyxa miuraensis]